MGKIYINFNDLDEDTQNYLIDEAEKNIDQEKRDEIQAQSDSSGYKELLREEAIAYLPTLDIEFNI